MPSRLLPPRHVIGLLLVGFALGVGLDFLLDAPPPPTAPAPPVELVSYPPPRPVNPLDWARWPVAGLGEFEVRDETVLQRATGLEWQREPGASPVTWEEAAAACAGSKLAGGGWRLPTRIELQGLVDYSRSGPAIDSAAFPGTPGAYFWSASPALWNHDQPWAVSFADGDVDAFGEGGAYRVRCVR